MYSAVYCAATGLRQQQLRLDVIADNISNINTAGFKAARLDFKDALYSANSIGPLASPEENHNKGTGVLPAAINRLHDPGSFITSESKLDFAIEGDGYFELENAAGDVLYTKSGNFYLSGLSFDEERYLVNSKGYYIHDENGQRIALPPGKSSIECTETGLLRFDGDEEGAVQLGLFTFTNVNGLESVGSSNFREGIASGEKMVSQSIVRQGALEGSNVKLGDEMTRMIRAQRAFSLASRALTTADDMEGIANNMKK